MLWLFWTKNFHNWSPAAELSIPAFSLVLFFFYLLFWRKAHKITLILINTYSQCPNVKNLPDFIILTLERRGKLDLTSSCILFIWNQFFLPQGELSACSVTAMVMSQGTYTFLACFAGFWLVWAVIVMLCCFCSFLQRRLKRRQEERLREQCLRTVEMEPLSCHPTGYPSVPPPAPPPPPPPQLPREVPQFCPQQTRSPPVPLAVPHPMPQANWVSMPGNVKRFLFFVICGLFQRFICNFQFGINISEDQFLKWMTEAKRKIMW